MTPRNDDDRSHLSRWDTVAVWLRFYTVHRDVEIPPVPLRKIGIGAAATLVVLVAVAVVAFPAIDRDKKRGERRSAAADAAVVARERREVIADQRVHVESLPASVAPRSIASRRALLRRATGAIAADARGRVGASRLKGPIRSVSCSPLPAGTPVHPERRLNLRFGRYECVAITAAVARSRVNAPFSIGYPFRLAVDFGTRRFGWCMVDPPAGEGSTPDPRRVAAPPRTCTDPRELARRGG